MIAGIGTDIVQIPRIEKVLAVYGERFISRILSENEKKKLMTLNKSSYANFLAKRFAAKEAISKAFGIGIGAQFSFKDVSITNDELGKPCVQITPNSPLISTFLDIHISLSDDYPISIAFVIITK